MRVLSHPGPSHASGPVILSVTDSTNSDVTHKRLEVDRRTIERAHTIIINDWESVTENQQTELLDPIEDGVVDRDQVIELGELFNGARTVTAAGRDGGGEGIVYYKNNSGLAIQFAAAGGIIYRKALAEGGCKEIPTEWLGSDLSAYHDAGFHPSP